MAICEYCELEHSGKYGSGRFCCQACARGFATRSKRELINKKLSGRRTGRPDHVGVCLNCEKTYTVPFTKRRQKFCSRRCGSKFVMNTSQGRENARKAGLISSSVQSSRRRSKNEKLFADMCQSTFNDVKLNCAMFNGWDADIIVEDFKVAVHWNGPWHYKKLTKKHSVSQVQNRDKIKHLEIEKMGYDNYVIKDMGSHDLDFVKKEFEKFVAYVKLQ